MKTKTRSASLKDNATIEKAASANSKKKYSLAALSVFVISSFGELIFSQLFGIDFGEAVKKVLIENAPLTVAASIISVRIYSIRNNDINFYFEFILCSLILCTAGYVTQLFTGHEIFKHAYEHAQHSDLGSWALLSKMAVATLFTITGYLEFYGMRETFMTIVAGAAMPWVILRKYNEYSEKISIE